MRGYLVEDKPFSNFLEEQICKNLNAQNYTVLIDFGCAFAVKTKNLINKLGLSYFIGIENNIWIKFFNFKKINKEKNFYIKGSLSKALKQFYKLRRSEGERLIFIANASMMYLDKSEKIQILNMLPIDTLIVITEPEDKTYIDIFDKTKLKIQSQSYIPKDVYKPGYKSEILIAIKIIFLNILRII